MEPSVVGGSEMQAVTKNNFQEVLTDLGIRTTWTKEEEKLAEAAAVPAHAVAEVKRIRSKYSASAFKKLRYYDTDKTKVVNLECQISRLRKLNRVSCSMTILRALKVIFKTLPRGSEVEIGFDWSIRYPFRVRWKAKGQPKAAYFWSGRMNLAFEREWVGL